MPDTTIKVVICPGCGVAVPEDEYSYHAAFAGFLHFEQGRNNPPEE